jgi:hypothetical protein
MRGRLLTPEYRLRHAPPAMNPRYALALALRGLPAETAAWLSRMADDLDRRSGLAERLHLLYPVLAGAAPTLPTLLPAEECATLAEDFIMTHGDGVARDLYSAAFLTNGPAALQRWSDLLLADIGQVIMERLKSGTLSLSEPKVWSFRSDDNQAEAKLAAFPFGDAEDERD